MAISLAVEWLTYAYTFVPAATLSSSEMYSKNIVSMSGIRSRSRAMIIDVGDQYVALGVLDVFPVGRRSQPGTCQTVRTALASAKAPESLL